MWSEESFVAGHPALDFLNTVEDTGKTRTHSLIAEPAELLSWIRARGLAERIAAGRQSITQETVDDLLRFREIAYHALRDVCAGEGAGQARRDLEQSLKGALQRARLEFLAAPAVWTVPETSGHYYQDSFALLVHELLQSPDFSRLRHCERCTWLFLNTGRGRGRRWCSMATCGNRAKVAAHRRRAHLAAPE